MALIQAKKDKYVVGLDVIHDLRDQILIKSAKCKWQKIANSMFMKMVTH
jgi:hypothetical protein